MGQKGKVAAMKIEVGKEIEFVQRRLNDIVYLAEHTQPVDGDWEGYAKQLARMLAAQATEAKVALSLATGQSPSTTKDPLTPKS